MHENGLRPEPPEWALDAGLPGPTDGEGFSEYVRRLGLDPEPLLEELTDRTLCIANVRLATALQDEMPRAWNEYVNRRYRERFHPTRDVSLPPT